MSKNFVIYAKKNLILMTKKFEIIVTLLVNIEVLLIMFVIYVCNGSKYDYRFIIKELAKEFKGQFKCLGENTEKKCYVTFSV